MMKNLIKFPWLAGLLLCLFLIACVDKKQLPKEDVLLAHVPMPAKLDSAMRNSFDKETYKILKKLNAKNEKSFKVNKENYLQMIEQIPAGVDRVAFSFVQFNKDKFPNQYQELAQFDGELYMLYYYMDKSGKNITGKAYAMLDVKQTIEINEKDYEIMENDYINNIKPYIDKVVKGTQGNTLRVKMMKDELLAYKNRTMTKKNVKNFKITLAQWVNYESILSKTESSILRKKLKLYTDENVGQMTFITDCQKLEEGNVESLSGFDLNHFCPQDCP